MSLGCWVGFICLGKQSGLQQRKKNSQCKSWKIHLQSRGRHFKGLFLHPGAREGTVMCSPCQRPTPVSSRAFIASPDAVTDEPGKPRLSLGPLFCHRQMLEKARSKAAGHPLGTDKQMTHLQKSFSKPEKGRSKHISQASS